MVRHDLSSIGEEKDSFKIALGYDPSDEPTPLFEYTFHLAELTAGEVVIVHALESVVSETIKEDEKKLKEQLEEILKNLNLPQVPFKFEFIYGIEIENFIQFVEKENINLFAFYYFKKFFGKTLSQEFIENLTQSGLFVVKEKIPFREIKNILVPVDFSESSSRQKDIVERIINKAPYEVNFTFLHVLEEQNESEREEAEMLFKELFEAYGKFKIRIGEPEEEILKELEENNYDLVIIGRTGRGLNLACGEVTKEVVEEAPCPVIVV